MSDTSPEIAQLVRDRLMALSGAERFLMGIRGPGLVAGGGEEAPSFRAILRRASSDLMKASPPTQFPNAICGPRFCSMKITEDVRKYAAQQGIAEEGALAKGMAEKAEEFVEKGSEVYAKA